MLANGPFEKALRSLEIYLLVNNNLCGKLISSLQLSKTFDKDLKLLEYYFFISGFK